MNDKYLHFLTAFKSLEELDLRTIPITDQGLKEIGKLENLKNLFLTKAKMTDAGLKELGKLEKLQHLNIWHSVELRLRMRG